MHHNHHFGKIGEQIARDYLIKKGYIIINQNLRIGYDEIDIIASYKSTLIFIEVKTRLTAKYGSAEAHITHNKIKRLKRSAFTFCTLHNINKHICLQAIAINLNLKSKKANISHFINII